MKASKPPTKTTLDYAAICDILDRGEEPVYDLPIEQLHAFSIWAKRNRFPVYYRTVEKGFLLSKSYQKGKKHDA